MSSQTIQFLQTCTSDDDIDIMKLVDCVIIDAVRAGASDIHIEPWESSIAVRVRLSGVLKIDVEPLEHPGGSAVQQLEYRLHRDLERPHGQGGPERDLLRRADGIRLGDELSDHDVHERDEEEGHRRRDVVQEHLGGDPERPQEWSH